MDIIEREAVRPSFVTTSLGMTGFDSLVTSVLEGTYTNPVMNDTLL